MTPRRTESRRPAGLLALVLVLIAARAAADTVTLAPTKDNTLFESSTGALSNGAGPGLYVGRTASHGVRRALLRFPVDANAEAGSTILSVQLVLSMNKTQSGAASVELRRVLADWGQGTWILIGPEGGGRTAKRFDSMESSPATVRPKLVIDFRRPVPVEPTAWSTVKALYKP